MCLEQSWIGLDILETVHICEVTKTKVTKGSQLYLSLSNAEVGVIQSIVNGLWLKG